MASMRLRKKQKLDIYLDLLIIIVSTYAVIKKNEHYNTYGHSNKTFLFFLSIRKENGPHTLK